MTTGKATAVAAMALAAFAILVRLPILSVPLERDEGAYAYVAWRMLHGEVPYRDVFDHKPPGIFVVYAAAIAGLGTSAEAIHLAAAFYNAATTALVILLAARLYGLAAGVLSGLLYAVSSTAPAYNGNAANTEFFLVLPMLAAVLLMWGAVSRDRSGGLLFAGGLAAGASMLFKPSAAPVVCFLVLAILVQRCLLGRRFMVGMSECGIFVLGALCPMGITLGLFAALGASKDFYEAVVLYNAAYRAEVTLEGARDMLGYVFRMGVLSQSVFWLFGLVGLAGTLLWRRREDVYASGFVLASAAGVAMGGWFLPHYLFLMLPAAAVVAGRAASGIVYNRTITTRPRAARYAALGFLAAVMVAVPLGADWEYFFILSPAQAARMLYRGNPFALSDDIADYLRQHTSAKEKIFIVGSEPQVLFLAQRRTATRYPYIYPLTQATATALERQREAIDSLRTAPPAYILVAIYDMSIVMRPNAPQEFFEELGPLVTRDYFLEAFVREEGDETLWAKGRWQVRQAAGLVPAQRSVLIFRKRSPGDTTPDIYPRWTFHFEGEKPGK